MVPNPEEQRDGRIRVLLVDDMEDLRTLLRIVFSRDGLFEVVGEAGDGETAVRQVSSLRPDLVLLDIAMPVMDGLAALPLVRQAAPDATILMLTAFQQRSLGDECRRLGADGYLEKGLSPQQLVAEVRHHLGRG